MLWFVDGFEDVYEVLMFECNCFYDYVVREIKVVCEVVGGFEIVNFVKYEFKGEGVCEYLNYIFVGFVFKSGCLVLILMLMFKGKFYGDLIVVCFVEDYFMLFGLGVM